MNWPRRRWPRLLSSRESPPKIGMCRVLRVPLMSLFAFISRRIDRPRLPALVWIHGGGYVLGRVEQDDPLARHLSKVASCVVASVEYRLAPEHPHPAPVEDCYAALKWFAAHADEFGVDRSCIALGGASAGGGLAAGLALLTRDRAEVELAYQLLIYPMIDDRNVAPASETAPDTFVWSRENNLMGWRAYLGHEPGGADVSPYAAGGSGDGPVRLAAGLHSGRRSGLVPG